MWLAADHSLVAVVVLITAITMAIAEFEYYWNSMEAVHSPIAGSPGSFAAAGCFRESAGTNWQREHDLESP